MNFEDDQSSASSPSSSSSDDIIRNPSIPPSPTSVPILHKKKAGRKKFRETRHPVYSGVRLKNCNKWVCEVREPNKKSRIWLGTFPSPEAAARAHDVAALALRGEAAKLNFPDSAELLPRAKSSSPRDIQVAVLEATRTFRSMRLSSSSSSFSFSPREINVADQPSAGDDDHSPSHVESHGKSVLYSSNAVFVDEEALFNMPGLLDSMAEGLLLTPPAMKRGFNWDDMGFDHVDVTLWRD
ncbi:dehydration-responsive element-binding protein 1F-like [Rhododendron vialii]|uniref:dehydration-responsive element-binding protein 1F-like n=1 Tax=Rhododendron vialii TaxID=182163 RepID=UPI00265F9043|nr:dehydration-responsive element-binding protein 1F-like [Rhododendron vialii]